jgi:hypothetical protein
MIVYHSAKGHSNCGDGAIQRALTVVGHQIATSRHVSGRDLILEPLPPPMPVKVLMRGGVWLDPPEEVMP